MTHWNQDKPWEDRYGDIPGQSTGWESDQYDRGDMRPGRDGHRLWIEEMARKQALEEYLLRLAKATEECQEGEE